MQRVAILCWVLVAVLLLVGCTQPCSKQAKPFLTSLDALLAEWQDAAALAQSTGRAALGGPIASFQGIRRKTEALEAPTCAQPIKDTVVEAMNLEISAYLDFMAQKNDSLVSFQLKWAALQVEKAKKMIRDIDAPKVTPSPEPEPTITPTPVFPPYKPEDVMPTPVFPPYKPEDVMPTATPVK